MSLLLVSVQYLAYIYHYVKERRKNPKWSLSCCLALLLPLNNLQKETGELAGRNILRQQLQTGRISMLSIANTVRESRAVDTTFQDHDAERKQQ